MRRRTIHSTAAALVLVAVAAGLGAVPAAADPPADDPGLSPSAVTWQSAPYADPVGDHTTDITSVRLSYDGATAELVLHMTVVKPPTEDFIGSLRVDTDRDRSTGCQGADQAFSATVVDTSLVAVSSAVFTSGCSATTSPASFPASYDAATGTLALRLPPADFPAPVGFDWYTTAGFLTADHAPDTGLLDAHGWVRPFSDVRTDAFYTGPVAWLRSGGWSTGIGATGTYEPDSPVTRGQMATFLWRMVLEQDAPPSPFVDIQRPSFYAAAVDWLYDANVTTGVGGTNQFRPNDPVTRGQMVTFLWRMQGSPAGNPAHGFVDVAPGTFYAEAVAWAKAEGITTGVGGTNQFRPDDLVTRGQMAAFLQRTFAPYSSAIYMT